MSAEVLSLRGVGLVRGDRMILDQIDWSVRRGERWAVLGPNGSGKTTLCRLASLYLHPSHGSVTVMGERLGQTDTRTLRRRIGLTSAALTDMLRPTLTVEQIVVTGKHADLAPWWHSYGDDDWRKAGRLLDRFGCRHLAGASLGTLSSGERQRVLLARTLMNDPALWLLDEPTAGLDLGGREQLVALLDRVTTATDAPTTIMVTHHVDEIPPGFSHLLLLKDGVIQAAGPIEHTMTAGRLSDCFGVSLQLERRAGRWIAWGDPASSGGGRARSLENP